MIDNCTLFSFAPPMIQGVYMSLGGMGISSILDVDVHDYVLKEILFVIRGVDVSLHPPIFLCVFSLIRVTFWLWPMIATLVVKAKVRILRVIFRCFKSHKLSISYPLQIIIIKVVNKLLFETFGYGFVLKFTIEIMTFLSVTCHIEELPNVATWIIDKLEAFVSYHSGSFLPFADFSVYIVSLLFSKRGRPSTEDGISRPQRERSVGIRSAISPSLFSKPFPL